MYYIIYLMSNGMGGRKKKCRGVLKNKNNYRYFEIIINCI